MCVSHGAIGFRHKQALSFCTGKENEETKKITPTTTTEEAEEEEEASEQARKKPQLENEIEEENTKMCSKLYA